jgi:hypothetical protein
VRVEEDRAAEDGVHGRVKGAGGEGGDSKRDKTGGNEALEGPVVGAVGGAGSGNGSWVVDLSGRLACEAQGGDDARDVPAI